MLTILHFLFWLIVVGIVLALWRVWLIGLVVILFVWGMVTSGQVIKDSLDQHRVVAEENAFQERLDVIKARRALAIRLRKEAEG